MEGVEAGEQAYREGDALVLVGAHIDLGNEDVVFEAGTVGVDVVVVCIAAVC